jgi:hypothetical protein
MLSGQAPLQDQSRHRAIELDHWIFVTTAAMGSGIIIILKSGFTPIPPRTHLRLDQAGDNLYYLGFTYTLCSLSITLYRFHSKEDAVDYIVSNFGIALATTIVGVVLRVWLHQMREDPLELEREARIEITDAVGRLRTEIDQAVREFNHF